MPQKKSNTTLVTEDALVDAVVARVADQFKQDMKSEMDVRFGRLEKALERSAPTDDSESPETHTRGSKRKADSEYDSTHQVRSRPAHAAGAPNQDSPLLVDDAPDLQPTAASRTLNRLDQQPSRAAMLDPTFSSGTHVNNNNNNPTWTAWLGASQRSLHRAGPAFGIGSERTLPHDFTGRYDHDLDAQVRHILETTPHQLKGNIQTGFFPFKYITRGPEKKKLSFNSLSLAEHMLGMFRMIEDDRIDPTIKPEIIAHMRDVVEDACEFDWSSHVRRWSEEVFDLIAEGRLPGGWGAHTRIQNLRTGMSRVESARISAPRESAQRDTATQRRYASASHQGEVLRGGPPCTQFNSSHGCSLQSGHVLAGKKQIHVCSYCLANTAAAHPHSESQCRTKQRHTSHF